MPLRHFSSLAIDTADDDIAITLLILPLRHYQLLILLSLLTYAIAIIEYLAIIIALSLYIIDDYIDIIITLTPR